MEGLEPLKAWVGFLALMISVGSSVWMIVTSPTKKTASDLEQLDSRMGEEIKALMLAVTALGTRTQALESEMKHLPDAKAFMEMRGAIYELSGKLGRMEENQLSTSRTVIQVQDYLMKSSAA